MDSSRSINMIRGCRQLTAMTPRLAEPRFVTTNNNPPPRRSLEPFNMPYFERADRGQSPRSSNALLTRRSGRSAEPFTTSAEDFLPTRSFQKGPRAEPRFVATSAQVVGRFARRTSRWAARAQGRREGLRNLQPSPRHCDRRAIRPDVQHHVLEGRTTASSSPATAAAAPHSPIQTGPARANATMDLVRPRVRRRAAGSSAQIGPCARVPLASASAAVRGLGPGPRSRRDSPRRQSRRPLAGAELRAARFARRARRPTPPPTSARSSARSSSVSLNRPAGPNVNSGHRGGRGRRARNPQRYALRRGAIRLSERSSYVKPSWSERGAWPRSPSRSFVRWGAPP